MDRPALTSRPLRDVLSLDFVWWIVTPTLAFMIAAINSIVPNDFWWHARTGAIILAERGIPTVDRFSFTRAGEPWTNFAWASEVVMHLLLSLGGPAVILFVHAFAISAGIVILLVSVARHSGIRAASLAVFVGAMVGVFYWHVRPQTASLVLFPLIVALIELHRNGRQRALIWAIPTFALWVNLHAGFVFGVLLLGIYASTRWLDARYGAAREEQKSAQGLVLISVASVAALALNPEGPLGVVRYLARLGTSGLILRHVTEYQPLVATTTDGTIFFASFALLMAVLARTRTAVTSYEAVALATFAVATLSAQRAAPWFGFVLVPPLARGVARWLGRMETSRGLPAVNFAVVALLASGVLVTTPLWRSRVPALAEKCPLVSRSTPVAAARFACARLPAGTRGFQDQVFASYLVLSCPGLPVFTDTRIELYTLEIYDDYRAIASGRWDWERVADRWALTYLFVSIRRERALIDAVSQSPRWRPIYRDDMAVLFARVF